MAASSNRPFLEPRRSRGHSPRAAGPRIDDVIVGRMRVERQPSRASRMLRLDKRIYLGQANNRSGGEGPCGSSGRGGKEHASDAMVLRSRAPRRARIEIIPMIDVVFFLLVFFMMASLAMTIYQGLPVNLPEAASGQRNAAETASITLSRDGGSFLNSEPVTVATLGGRIRPLLAKNRRARRHHQCRPRGHPRAGGRRARRAAPDRRGQDRHRGGA